MSRTRGTATRSRGLNPPTKSEITKTQHTDASASCNVLISNTKNGQESVYTKEYHMAGLSDIAPRSPDQGAKVTCSFDLSTKSYGNGAAVMCSVTLNSAQNEDAIRTAFTIARAICEEEGAEALRMAQTTFQRVAHES
jgi:hypothetical protein